MPVSVSDVFFPNITIAKDRRQTSTGVLTPHKPEISHLNGEKIKKLTGQLNGQLNGKAGQPTPHDTVLGSKSPPADDSSLAEVKIPHGKGMATFSLQGMSF